jgi:hypothetical protein
MNALKTSFLMPFSLEFIDLNVFGLYGLFFCDLLFWGLTLHFHFDLLLFPILLRNEIRYLAPKKSFICLQKLRALSLNSNSPVFETKEPEFCGQYTQSKGFLLRCAPFQSIWIFTNSSHAWRLNWILINRLEKINFDFYLNTK